jgi:hypothetical protein
MRVDLGGIRSPENVRLPALLGQECARGTRLANWADGRIVSHYRTHPAVLPSLRALDAPYPGEGDRSRWNEDVDEQIARLRAASAPCPGVRGQPCGIAASGVASVPVRVAAVKDTLRPMIGGRSLE